MPLQLVEFEKTPTEEDKDGSTIKIETDNLDQVLKLCGDRPLCVICICGPSRQGKSFILGHIIRCFDALEKNIDDWMDWGNPKKPLDKGFTWQNAYGPVTQGIWIWERPFILKSNDGKECAVLLIDTQGTYDEFTSNKDMTAIVGLSLLMSSVMIFNFFTNLQEDILSSLGTYIEYGLLALEDTDSERPFQRLKFLIRDWNNPTEFPFGEKGGAEFIRKKLELKDNQPESAQKVRKTIKKCFQNMSCFLMPAIGDKALAKDYDGNIAALNRNFANKMEEFVTKLSDKELVIKRIVGSEITAKELKTYMNMYVETFNSSTIPSAMSMWEATTLVANNNTLEKAKKLYQDTMSKLRRGKKYLNPEAFQEAHNDAKNDTMDFFKNAKKYGDNIKKFEDDLLQFIENELKVIEADNQMKRNKFLSSAEEEAKEYFQDSFTSKFIFENEDDFWEESCIEKEASMAMSSVMDELKDQLTDETEEDIAKLVEAMEKSFKQIVESIKTKNRLHEKNAVEKIETLLETGVENYKGAMKAIVNEADFDDVDTLEMKSAEERNRIFEDFDNSNKPGNKEFQLKFRTQLGEKMEKEWGNIELQFKLKMNEMTEQAENEIASITKEYKEFLKAATQEKMITGESEEQLKNDHNDWVKEYLEKLEKSSSFPEGSKSLERLRDKLNEQLETSLEQALSVVKEHLRKREELLEKAVRTCSEWYQLEIRRSVDKYLSEDELLQKHDDVKEKALEKFQNETADKGLEIEAHKEELENLIESNFEQVKQVNQEKGEMELSKARNEIHACVEKYKKEMKNVVENLKFENGKAASIQRDHENLKVQVESMLLERCAKLDGSKQEELLSDLKSGIETAFKEVSKSVEFKELEMKSAIRDVLDRARQYYHGEMQKNIDNEVYMEPGKLQELHNRVSNTAVRQNERDLKEEHKQELRAGLDLSFIKYKEENQMRFNSEASEIAIGIDLGTTYCCVGAYFKGKIRIIKNSIGANITPSYLALKEDDTEMIGELAKKGAFKDPENTIYDAKRMIGRKWDDPKLQHDIKYWPFTVVNDGGVPKIKARGKTFYPEQISAKLLKHLKNEAEKELQRNIKKVVITVPAYFTDGQRQATVDAGEIAGFEVLEILNEPTAAALAYKFQKINDDAKKVLIFDLGGGTFDVAVLDMKVNEIKVLAVDGDTHLGGEDFDKAMMEFCAETFKAKKGIDLFEGKDSPQKPVRDKARMAIRRLQTYSEDRKKDLAQMTKTEVTIDNIKNGEDISVEVTRAKFEEINLELFKKTLVIVDRALAAAKVKKDEIDDIVLVGGSTRIPRVQSMLKEHFGGKKSLNHTIHPDEAVAYGAAVRAAMLNGADAPSEFSGTRIYDVTPMSMGIEVLGGGFSVIIKKGSNVPSTHQHDYTTAYDNQTSASIKIFQGEERIAENNEPLGSFELEGIPPNRARTEKILVKMDIDKMGVLQVTAVSIGSGSENKLTVKADKSRLSDEEKRRLMDEEASQYERQTSNDSSSRDYDYDTEKNTSDKYTDEENESEDEKWDY